MKPRIRAAAVIVKNNSVLFVKHKKDSNEYWLLPGGGLKPAETLIDALKRELIEEVSLHIKVKELLFVNDSISPNKDRHILQLVFKCEIESGQLAVNPDHRLCDASYFKFNEIKDVTLRPNIKKALLEYLSKNFIKNVYLGNIWE